VQHALDDGATRAPGQDGDYVVYDARGAVQEESD
jgi:hypothetical protein